jgi:hypothetical protein
VIGVLLTAAASTASAEVIFSSNPPFQQFIYFADTDYSFTQATTNQIPFTLAEAATITGAEWWGGCVAAPSAGSAVSDTMGSTSNSCPNGDFVLSIHEEVGHVEDPLNPGTVLPPTPGVLVGQRDVGNAGQTLTGNLISGYINEYAYSATFAGIELAADTPYFFSVSNSVAGTNTWGMEAASGEDNHYQLSSTGALTVQNLPLAFRLLVPDDEPAPVPEPMTLSLLGVGVASVVFCRRKRQS